MEQKTLDYMRGTKDMIYNDAEPLQIRTENSARIFDVKGRIIGKTFVIEKFQSKPRISKKGDKREMAEVWSSDMRKQISKIIWDRYHIKILYISLGIDEEELKSA